MKFLYESDTQKSLLTYKDTFNSPITYERDSWVKSGMGFQDIPLSLV